MTGPSEQRPHILVIEDDTVIAGVVTRSLERAGFHTTLRTDGQSAVETLQNLTPDLIILDLLLPKLHGFEVLEKIKERPPTTRVPVLVLTNLGSQSDMDKAMGMGAVAYLVKALVTPEEIVDRVRTLLTSTTPTPHR